MESVLPLSETHSPESTDATAQIVRAAAGAGTPVYPVGGGTASNYGGRPTREGIGLSFDRQNGLVDYPTRDLTITVESGMTVAELQRLTAKEGQRLPVDIPQAAVATVGGAVAAAPAGPRRFACGTLRDYVLGLDVVDGTGNVFSTGGRVVKNAAGYDLSRLFTGSLGSLGIITKVTLMVKPIPEIWGFHACRCDRPERLLECLAGTRSLPCALEVLSGPAWSSLPGRPSDDSRRPLVLVGFEGPEAEVGWMLDTIEAEWASAGASECVNILGEDADALWTRLCEFPAPTPGEPTAVVEIGVLPNQVAELVETLRRSSESHSIQAHAGNGVVRVRRPGGAESEIRQFIAAARRLAAEARGRATVLSVPPEIALSAEEAFGPVGSGFALMRRLKERFDPKDILNPGRMVY